MALKYTTQINEDECIGDSLDTINSSFSALDIGLQDVASDMVNVEGRVLNIIRAGEFVGTWVTMPVDLSEQTNNFFLKYNYSGQTAGEKWVMDSNIYSGTNAVGIGTKNPLAKLHINTESNQIGLRVDSTQQYASTEIRGISGGNLKLTRTGTGAAYLVELTSVVEGANNSTVGGRINVLGDYFDIRTGTSTGNLSSLLYATPSDGGRLGVGGVTSPLAKLDIGANAQGGDIRFRGGSSASFDFVLDAKDNDFKIRRYTKGSTSGAATFFNITTQGDVKLTNNQLNVSPSGTTLVKPTSWIGGVTSLDFYSDGGTLGAGVSGSVLAYLNNEGVVKGSTFLAEDERAGGTGRIEVGGQLGGYIDFKTAAPGSVNATDGQIRLACLDGKNYLQSIGEFNIYNSTAFDNNIAGAVTTFTSGGRVGLNYATPQTKLHVNGAITLEGENLDEASIDTANESNTYIKFGIAGSSNDYALVRQIGATNNYHLTIDLHDDGNSGGYTQLGQTFSVRNVGSSLDPDEVVSMIHATNNSIAGTGEAGGTRVGINTNAPTQTLDVNGNIRSRGNLLIDGSITASLGITVSAVAAPYVQSGDVRTEVLYLSGGRVFPPGDSLLAQYFKYTGSASATTFNNNAYIAFGPAGSQTDLAILRQIGNDNNFHLALDLHDNADGLGGQAFSIRNVDLNGPYTNFHVDGYGRVGINNDSPTGVLHIASQGGDPTVRITSSNTNALVIESSSNNPLITVNSSGYLGIATSTPGYHLDVNGTTNTSNLIANIATVNTTLNLSGNANIGNGGTLFLGRRNNSNLGGQFKFGRAYDNATAFSVDVVGTQNDFYNYSPSLRIVRDRPEDNGQGPVLMFINGRGNVGFGTSAPLSAMTLTVSGDSYSTGSWANYFTAYARTTADGGSVNFNRPSDDKKRYSISCDGTGDNPRLRFISFASNLSAECLTLLDTTGVAGKVGINQQNPEYPLDVNGAIRGAQLRSSGAIMTSESNEQNNITLTDNEINSGFLLGANKELAINKQTNNNSQFRDFSVYDGKGSPLLQLKGTGNQSIISDYSSLAKHGIKGSVAIEGNFYVKGTVVADNIPADPNAAESPITILRSDVDALQTAIGNKISKDDLVTRLWDNTNNPQLNAPAPNYTAGYTGTNSYGQIKFPKNSDGKGVMIQWGKILQSNVANKTYFSGTITFPQTFVSEPVVFIQDIGPDDGAPNGVRLDYRTIVIRLGTNTNSRFKYSGYYETGRTFNRFIGWLAYGTYEE